MLRRILPESFSMYIVAFATALRMNSSKAFVFVGGSAQTFGFPSGYDASIAFVITILNEAGVPCNNAPETHGMHLGNDNLHFREDMIPRLVEMWSKAVRSAANSTSRFLVIKSLQLEL